MKRITYQKLRAYFNYEDTRWRIQKKIRYILRKKHNGDLKNSQFTIISNNCWGGGRLRILQFDEAISDSWFVFYGRRLRRVLQKYLLLCNC